MQNGRINFDRDMGASGSAADLPGYGYNKLPSPTAAEDSVRGIMEVTPVCRAFFSPLNFQIIQNMIRRDVFDQSQGELLIDEQSTTDIEIVMRSMYLQYGLNQSTRIPEQINDLNKMVANWCVPNIISACRLQQQFLYDITHSPEPLPQPINMSQRGTKSAQFDRFL